MRLSTDLNISPVPCATRLGNKGLVPECLLLIQGCEEIPGPLFTKCTGSPTEASVLVMVSLQCSLTAAIRSYFPLIGHLPICLEGSLLFMSAINPTLWATNKGCAEKTVFWLQLPVLNQ